LNILIDQTLSFASLYGVLQMQIKRTKAEFEAARPEIKYLRRWFRVPGVDLSKHGNSYGSIGKTSLL